MNLLQRKLLVRSKLAVYPSKVVTKEAFLSLCATNDRVRGLDTTEAGQFLQSLCAAGSVAPLGKNLYHINPADVINAVHLQCGLPVLEANLPAVIKKRRDLTSTLEDMTRRTSDMVRKATIREKEFWAVTTFLSGAQMLVLAYMTFLLWGWDVMEPVTYFVTTVTALVSYGYFLHFRREHTYEHLDNVLLPRNLTQDILASDIDVKRWLKEIEMHKELDRIVLEDSLLTPVASADASDPK